LSRHSAKQEDPKVNFSKDLKILVKNPSYLLLVASFNFLYGIYTALGAVVSTITAPYGYTSNDNSVFGATFIMFGVFSSFVVGIILDKTSKYKLILNILCFSSMVTISVAFFTLPSKNVFLLAANLAFVGITVIPVIPVCYSFAVELTYPLPE
jgi:Na+/melibiose symporter-like transporter